MLYCWKKQHTILSCFFQQYSILFPAALLPITILVEFGGGLALLFGFQARLAALGLGVFSIITAFIFHGTDDQMQQINFMKNLAMAGGLFYLMLYGAGRLSLDHAIEK